MRYIILILLFSVSTIYSQITNAEYYFDAEPSIGNGTAIAVTAGNTINETINIDISSLTTGFHVFYVRTKNTNNVWSLYDKNVFYISEAFTTSLANITDAEYYFDTEPGVGNGTTIPVTASGNINETINVDVSSLNVGFHVFYVRTKNTDNVWSLYDKNVFYILETFTGSLTNITDAEYYFDTEPGINNGTAIPVTAGNTINEVINLDISALTTGFHTFYVRTKTADNVWSLYDKNVFYISEIVSTTISPIVAAEYFIDTHVSVGNGTAITLNPNGNGTYDTTISPTGLNEGDHLLFIRTQNDEGVWSLYDVVPFIIDNDVVITPLKAYLQGPLLTATNGLQNDDLRTLNYLPTTSPYADGATVDASVYNTIGNNAIVDWVWIELRDTINNIVVSASALLQRDGDIVTLNGVDALSFSIPAGNYYIVIKHRNHLGVMSANAIALTNSSTTIDFTDSNFITYGSNAQVQLVNGFMALWTGDATDQNIIKFSGSGNGANIIKSTVLNDPSNGFGSATFTSTGYLNSDLDLDGGAKFSGANNDSNIIKGNILNYPSNGFGSVTYTINTTVPNATLLNRTINTTQNTNIYLPPSEEVRRANELDRINHLNNN